MENLFKFEFEGIQFFIEVPNHRRFGLYRLFDTINEFFHVRPDEIFFYYYNKRILSINTAETFGECILIKRFQEDEKKHKVCKLVLRNSDNVQNVWAVSNKDLPVVGNFLSVLSEDDEFKEIFKQEFEVFYGQDILSFEQNIPEFKDFCQLEIKPKAFEGNPIKIEVKSFGYPSINVYFNATCTFQVFMKNIAFYYGFMPDTCKFFLGKSLIENKEDILINYDLHQKIIDVVYNIGGSADNHFKNRIEFNPNAPDFRRVVKGLNFKCICLNSEDCKLFKKIFMSNMGYGKFSLNICKFQIKCPGCNLPGELKAFGIYKARLEVIRFYKAGDLKKYDLFENFEDFYMSLDCFLAKFPDVADMEFQVTEPQGEMDYLNDL